MAAGSNDVYLGRTLAQIQTDMTALAQLIRLHLSAAIIYVNVFPRRTETAPVKAVRKAVNQYWTTLPNGASGELDRTRAVQGPDELMRPELDSGDGTHLVAQGQLFIAASIISGERYATNVAFEAYADAGSPFKGRPGTADAFTLPPATYTISSVGNAGLVANLPEIHPGTLIIDGNPGEVVRALRFSPHGKDYAWETVTYNTVPNFLPWGKINEDPPPPPAPIIYVVGIANALRIDDASQRWGGAKKTGGKAMVSMRIDHGLANFNSIARPLLEARNIPYTIALSSRHWDHVENTGVTPAMVDSWVQGGLCTIANHGANAHQDAVTVEDLTDQIVTGLAELRTQLPSAMIDMWLVPGVGGTGYNGFGSGGSPEAFYNTDAGRLILENHAFSSGTFPGADKRVLDGKVRQGGRHITIDATTPSALATTINNAKTGVYGVQLMLHPSQLNLTDKLTTAQLTEILDNIATLRDAGDIVVGSSYDLVLADARV